MIKLHDDISAILQVLKPDMTLYIANLARNEAAVLDKDNPVCRIDTDFKIKMSKQSGTLTAKVNYSIDFVDIDTWDEYDIESAKIIDSMTKVSNTVMFRLNYRNIAWTHDPLWRVNNSTMSGVRTSLSFEYQVLPSCVPL